MRVVIDTNVLVSGLLTSHGPCGQIVQLALDEQVNWQVDHRILREYRQVLSRPKFQMLACDVSEVCATVEACSEFVIALPLRAELPDLSDRPFLEVAHAAGAVLVTGNLRHFPPDCRGAVRVFSPREFLDYLASSSSP